MCVSIYLRRSYNIALCFQALFPTHCVCWKRAWEWGYAYAAGPFLTLCHICACFSYWLHNMQICNKDILFETCSCSLQLSYSLFWRLWWDQKMCQVSSFTDSVKLVPEDVRPKLSTAVEYVMWNIVGLQNMRKGISCIVVLYIQSCTCILPTTQGTNTYYST